MPAIDPAVVKPAAQYLIKGCFSMMADELRGWNRRKSAPDMPAELTIPEYELLPSLDDSRIGDALAPPPDAEATEAIPADLFVGVVGLEHEKRVLRRVAESSVPMHAVLVGPPGSAKSLLLEELGRLDDTRYIVGANMTSSGLIAMFVDSGNPPRMLLIDEIEMSDPNTLATLRVLMDGKATRAVHGKPDVEQEVDVRVVAAANSTAKVPSALRTRFIELTLPEYTTEQRREVIAQFLQSRHSVEQARAEEIATLVADRGGDTRDAVQAAQMWEQDPDTAKEIVKRIA